MFRTPAQPSFASSKASKTPCGPRSGGLSLLVGTVITVLAATSACVFVPPPLLPEEIAALEASKAARKSAARAAAPGPATEAGDGAAGPELTFKKGDEAPRGMNAAQLKAYNAAQGDPEASEFTLEEALAGLGGTGDELWAQLKTPRGVIECQLFADKTPKTVANFIGLARGLRPSYDKATDSWVKRPYFNNIAFHRVIPGFMIQGGDPTGTGTGNPGYVIEDEIRPDLIHDAPGVLSMANKGPNTGSAQFFITLNPTPHLDGLHTVFGLCNDEGTRLADDIALVPRGEGDKPKEPELLETISIVRRAAAKR